VVNTVTTTLAADPREVATYDVAEVAHYLRLPPSTVRAWVIGQKEFKSLIRPASDSSPTLSFVNLVEIHVLAAIRRHHRVPMPKVRLALENLDLPTAHPLADARFQTDGVDLFIRRLDDLVNLSRPTQRTMREVIEAHLHRVVWATDDLPLELFPFTTPNLNSRRSVMINPRIAFGRLVIAKTGIPTLTVAQRYLAGDSVDELAEDYGRARIEIEDALRCEFARAA